MMKIKLISDVHIEHGTSVHKIMNPSEPADVLVAAITELVDKDYTFYYNRVLLEIEVFK